MPESKLDSIETTQIYEHDSATENPLLSRTIRMIGPAAVVAVAMISQKLETRKV